MKDLRAAAKWLGVSTAGSKQKILDRLNYTIKREERRQATLLALEHMTKDDRPVKDQRLPRLPSKLERRLRNLSHLPYKAWCDVCVMAKAQDNSEKRIFPAPSSTREFPTVQMDFGTVSGGISVLVLVDVWTRYCEAKQVELVCDQEKVLLAGLELAKETRSRMGLPTTLNMNKAFDEAKTSMAERFSQTVRNQAKALVLQ